MDLVKEQELVKALHAAEDRANGPEIEQAINRLALFYVASGEFSAAVPFWRRGAKILASTAPDSAELATCLHNMAATCLLPAGLRDEAHGALRKARELYELHLGSDAPCMKEIEDLLR